MPTGHFPGHRHFRNYQIPFSSRAFFRSAGCSCVAEDMFPSKCTRGPAQLIILFTNISYPPRPHILAPYPRPCQIQKGYLFVSVVISDSHDMANMIAEAVGNDLRSTKELHVCLALNCIVRGMHKAYL